MITKLLSSRKATLYYPRKQTTKKRRSNLFPQPNRVDFFTHANLPMTKAAPPLFCLIFVLAAVPALLAQTAAVPPDAAKAIDEAVRRQDDLASLRKKMALAD